MYSERKFDLPSLEGISPEQVTVHLGLYAGYVKHTNVIQEKLAAMRKDPSPDAYTMSELRRRFGFEFNGMRMHEYYFEQLEGGATAQDAESALAKAATDRYGSYENLVAHIREVAGTRGIGWVVVYFDAVANELVTVFVADHELGQLAGLPVILALDVWEHAYMVDYKPADKSKYIDAFFKNLNWSVVESRFTQSK